MTENRLQIAATFVCERLQLLTTYFDVTPSVSWWRHSCNLLAPGSDTVYDLLSGLCFIIPASNSFLVSHDLYCTNTDEPAALFCVKNVGFPAKRTSLYVVINQYVLDCAKGGFPLECHICPQYRCHHPHQLHEYYNLI